MAVPRTVREGKIEFKYEPWMREEDFPPPIPFPSKSISQSKAISMVKKRMARNTPREKMFHLSVEVEAHPFAKRIFCMPEVIETFQAAWARGHDPGSYEIGNESVRMICSLLGATNPEAGGFLTVGGTESNLHAVRLARDLAKKARPEMVTTQNCHYSPPMGAEAFGVKLQVAGLNPDQTVKMEEVESMINENTIMLHATCPELSIGRYDPVEEFAELADKHGLFLHVDGAFGGFWLPFVRELGYKVPPFDFRVPQVNSMIADPHKLLSQKPISAFIIRDRAYLKAIPVEQTYMPVLSGSGRIGAAAVAFWALTQHLGMEGYVEYVRKSLELTKWVREEVDHIDGLETGRSSELFPWVVVTSKRYKMFDIHEKLTARGYILGKGTIPDGEQTPFMRIAIDPLKKRRSLQNLIADLKITVKGAGA